MNNEQNLWNYWPFVFMVIIGLMIIPFQVLRYFFFPFKNITTLPTCRRHYVVVGRVFDAYDLIPS